MRHDSENGCKGDYKFVNVLRNKKKVIPREPGLSCRLPSPMIASWHPRHSSPPQFSSTLNLQGK